MMQLHEQHRPRTGFGVIGQEEAARPEQHAGHATGHRGRGDAGMSLKNQSVDILTRMHTDSAVLRAPEWVEPAEHQF